MKKSDVELIIETLNDVKTISNRLDYNSSTAINKRLMTVLSLLETEYTRMSEDKIEINSPKIMLVGVDDIKCASDNKMSLTEFTNDMMEDLVNKGYKILDYGPVINNGTIIVYIKYTD